MVIYYIIIAIMAYFKRSRNVKESLSSILKQCKKVSNVNSMLEVEASIIELCREDIRKIARAKGFYFIDFDWIFKESVEMTRKTLKKTHLKIIQRYANNEIDKIVEILMQRILANMRNIAFDARYKSHVAKNEIEEAMHLWIQPYHQDYELEIMFEQLHDMDHAILQAGLQQVWVDALNDSGFDKTDFLELCEKYGFTLEEVMEDIPLLKAEQTAGGNQQLVLFFDPND